MQWTEEEEEIKTTVSRQQTLSVVCLSDRERSLRRSYQNKDGQTVYTTDIIVDDQEFADSKGQGSGSSSYPKESSGPFMGGSDSLSEGFMSIPDGVEDEGLPFT